MFLKVSDDKIVYTEKPQDSIAFTNNLDRQYSKYAGLYDRAVKMLPFWKKWITAVIPHIEGPRVLEVSFGPGYLLTQYANDYETYGIDFNPRMIEIAQNNLAQKSLNANLRQANVEGLPFQNEFFDTIINTMAFCGYPDGEKAMSEFYRVLKNGGRLLLVDFEYPSNRNLFGYALTRLMEKGGCIIKDIAKILEQFSFDYSEKEIGGFGGVHLYIARKRD